VAKSYEDVMNSTSALINEKHDYKTVVYDTLDWFEPLVWNYLIRQQPADERGKPITNIEGYGYGKGYKFALDYWSDFISLTDRLRFERDMMIIYIIHSSIRKITPPDMDSYEMYMPKLQDAEKTSAKDKIVEHCDIVLFGNWRTSLTDEKTGFGASRKRAVGSGQRIIYTEQRPAYEAKNRYDLPSEIHVKEKNWSEVWAPIAQNVPWFSQFYEAPEQQPQQAQPVQTEIAAPTEAPQNFMPPPSHTPPVRIAPTPTPAPTTLPDGEKLPKFFPNKA
jgi:hypothetical protein